MAAIILFPEQPKRVYDTGHCKECNKVFVPGELLIEWALPQDDHILYVAVCEDCERKLLGL